MKTLLLTLSLFITLPLAADQSLEQLDQKVSVFYRNREYDAALTHVRELLRAAKDKGDTSYTVRSCLVQGFIYAKTEEFGKAVLSYLEGARFAGGSPEKEVKESLISIYKNVAMIMGDYRHFDLAHKFNAKGLEVAIEINDEKQIINLLQNEGNEYFEDDKFDSTILVIDHILTHYNPEFRKRIGLENNLGLAYWNSGNLDEAIAQYTSILASRDSVEDTGFLAKVIHNLGLALMDKQEYEKALVCFKEAAAINAREGFTNTLFGNYKNIGRSWDYLGDKDEAIAYYLKAASLFDGSYVDPEDYDIFQLIGDFYSSNDQMELAREYEEKYIDYLAAFEESRNAMQLPAELLLQVEELFTQQSEEEEKRRETERLAMLGLGGSGALLLLFTAYYLRHRRRLRAVEKRINEILKNSKV